MHVKLLQTTFSDSHRPRRGGPPRVLGASTVSKVSPNFPICPSSSSARHYSHLLPFLGNNVWRDPVVAYATELSTRSTACMRGSEPVLGQEAGDQFRIFALVFDASRKYSYYVCRGVKSFSFESHRCALGVLQPVVVIKIVPGIWYLGSRFFLIITVCFYLQFQL